MGATFTFTRKCLSFSRIFATKSGTEKKTGKLNKNTRWQTVEAENNFMSERKSVNRKLRIEWSRNIHKNPWTNKNMT